MMEPQLVRLVRLANAGPNHTSKQEGKDEGISPCGRERGDGLTQWRV